MLNISDIVALAKAGYKVSDVKELISMSQQPEPKSEPDPEPKSEPEPEPKAEPEPEPKAEPEPEPEPNAEPDSEVAKLKKQIADMQAANLRKSMIGKETPTDQDVINDLVRSFM